MGFNLGGYSAVESGDASSPLGRDVILRRRTKGILLRHYLSRRLVFLCSKSRSCFLCSDQSVASGGCPGGLFKIPRMRLMVMRVIGFKRIRSGVGLRPRREG